MATIAAARADVGDASAPRTIAGWSSTNRASACPPAHGHAQYGGGTAGRASARAACSQSGIASPPTRSVISGTTGAAPGVVLRTMKSRRSSGVTPPVWTVPGRDARRARAAGRTRARTGPAPTTTSTRAAAANHDVTSWRSST